ncbi:MAG: cytochrome P450, partial [Acidimicrobiia bacterium]
PYRFIDDRDPNDHTTFGRHSAHLCLGAHLARLELRILLEELLDRVAAFEVDGPIERLRSNFIAGMKRLPLAVAWGPAR